MIVEKSGHANHDTPTSFWSDDAIVEFKYFLKSAAKSPSGLVFLGYPHFLLITLCATGAWQAKSQISCGSEQFAHRGCSFLSLIKSRTCRRFGGSRNFVEFIFCLSWQGEILWISGPEQQLARGSQTFHNPVDIFVNKPDFFGMSSPAQIIPIIEPCRPQPSSELKNQGLIEHIYESLWLVFPSHWFVRAQHECA